MTPTPSQTSTPASPLASLFDAGSDLRYARRLFARQPGILLLAVLGLSLGLGIATSAFSIMNAAVVRGEGLIDPDRVPGVLRTTDRSTSTSWRYDEFVQLREASTRMALEAVLTESALMRGSAADADPPASGVAFVSGGFFAATGGRVIAGRTLAPGDEQHAGPPPVVVSHLFWTTRLNRDPQAIGRTIEVGRTTATIVGIAERGFSVPHNRSLWLPLTAFGAVYNRYPSAQTPRAGDPGPAGARRTPAAGLELFGRLLPDSSIAEAEAQLSGVASALPRDAAGGESAVRVRLDRHVGLGRVSTADTLAITILVFAVIGLVLLLACANVATVLVSTAITREREMAVRAAIGASRGRIVRQLVTESLALGAVAAGVGLLFAFWAIPVIGTMIEAPEGTDLAPDLNVYLFLGVVTLITGVAAGLAPAWHGRGVDLLTPLKGEGAREHRIAPRRLRSLLVMTQAAVSVLLIVLSTLFIRATFHAATIDVGFDGNGLYAVSPGLGDPAHDGGAGVRNFWTRALAELHAVPGIVSVTLTELTPYGGVTRTSIPRDGSGRVVYFNRTRAEYFETMRLRILAGRSFTRDEVASGAPVALVSQSLARAYWPDRSPLGELVAQDIPVPPAMTVGPGGPSLTESRRPVVIGVVADAITERLHERNSFAVYEPLAPTTESFAQLMIRVAPGTTGALQEATQRLRAIDPHADIRITSIAERVEQEASQPRTLATITGVVGIIAIVLCVIGLYGLTASVVGQRAREMGVRVAMGAEPPDLLRLLMWDSLRPVALGLIVGAGAAILAGRLVVASMFFGVPPDDPIAFIGAALILLAAAVLAVLLPTRRAAGVDAAVVLRRA